MPLSFVFLAYRICALVLKLQNTIASDTHCDRLNTIKQQQALDQQEGILHAHACIC